MKRSRFTEEQIIGVLREQETGQTTAAVYRRHGISEATFDKWKTKYGGMGVSEARRRRALEDEKLRRLLAEAMLEVAMLKDIASKNGDARRAARSRGTSACGARAERASGVPGDWDGQDDGALLSAAARWSLAWPSVRSMISGRPIRSQTTWSLEFSPPFVRPTQRGKASF